MVIRLAGPDDLAAIVAIYNEIHTMEEAGRATTGWDRSVYPTAATAEKAILDREMYVLCDAAEVLAAARINMDEDEAYTRARWQFAPADGKALVLHTLVVLPKAQGRGLGSEFVRFYERHARALGIHALRMDTNARNKAARRLYQKLGYHEADIVPCTFNGIRDVPLVCLEKQI